MAVQFVSVISKDNVPLYFRSYGVPNDLELHLQYLVHTCLDIIDEETSWEAAPSAHSDPREYYLGVLSYTEDYKVYGYATNTRVKFVIVTENVPVHRADMDMKELFRMLHTAYVEALCNPFYVPGEKIHTKKFDNTVLRICQRSRAT